MSLARKANGFNRLAPWYDGLVSLFFGDALFKATTHFLNTLPKQGTLLVVGGGTGNFLPTLTPGTRVIYVDFSAKMIAKAQARANALPESERPSVVWYCCSWDEIPPGVRADTLLTPFFLDCFKDAAQPAILKKLSSHLAKDGVWLLTDFNIPEAGKGRLRGKKCC